MRLFGMSLLLLVFATAMVALSAEEAPKAKPSAVPAVESAVPADATLSAEQKQLARLYLKFETDLLRIAQRMERQGGPENRDKSQLIHKAVQQSREKNVRGGLNRISELLQKAELKDLKTALDEGSEVKSELERILAILMTEDAKDTEKFLKELLAQLDAAIRAQDIAKARNLSEQVNKQEAKKAQDAASEQVKKILEKIAAREKEKEAKEAKESKDAKGDPKSPKPNEGKDGKDSDKKPKGGKDGKPMPGDDQNKDPQGKDQKPAGDQQPPQEKTPGRKKIKDAAEDQKKAEEDIDKNSRKEGADKQDDAKRKLEEAKKQLEEILRQMREEEIERILAALRERCEKMLRMQEVVYESTKKIDQKVQSSADKKPSREEEQDARVQADQEDAIVVEADQAIRILQTEGSAVAFPEVFHQVRSDMTHVSKRLGRADVATETQAIEADIIAALKEMIKALEKAQKDQQDRKNQPNQQSPANQNQSLIDLIAELKMIRAMQVRVNNRTTLWGKRYPGEEQAQMPDIITELKDLAKRQLRIYEVTHNIAKGKNQ